MKYITVKLTEDQANYMIEVLDSEINHLVLELGCSENHGMVTFTKRLMTKLAKAKTEAIS